MESAAGFPQWRAESLLREFFDEPRQFANGIEIVWFWLGIWFLREFQPGSDATASENSYCKPIMEQPTEFFVGAPDFGIHFVESRLFDFQPKLFVQEHFSFDARLFIVRIVVDARIVVALLQFAPLL